MEKLNHFFLLALVGALTFAHLNHAQDRSDFISIDCGFPDNTTYTDNNTGIAYVSDSIFIDTGVPASISNALKNDSLDRQLLHVRSFSQGTKNCYALKPSRGKKYFIRARFLYGNYDAKNQAPVFDLYIGVTFLASIRFEDASRVVDKEVVHMVSSNTLYLCLMNKGQGTPFISAIELRPIWRDDIYRAKSGSLAYFLRVDFGLDSKLLKPVRYRDDPFDRIWYQFKNLSFSWKTISTTLPISAIDAGGPGDFLVPSGVMGTAITPSDPSQPLNFSWTPEDPRIPYYVYMHFAEIQQLQDNDTRIFNITYDNGYVCLIAFRPWYLQTYTVFNSFPLMLEKYEWSLSKFRPSTLPPLINALEVYTGIDIVELQTTEEDGDAIMNIKSTYGVKRNWQGDPCGPQDYVWDGISCTTDGSNISRVISLNLSSSGLNGYISPAISDLNSLRILDLSNNNLTGPIPDSLAQLPFLEVLNLSGNNLRGSIPPELLNKQRDNKLTLSWDGNLHLCNTSDSCHGSESTGKMSYKELTTVIGALAGGLLIILLVAVAMFYCHTRKRLQRQECSTGTFERESRKFTYSEVLRITNNFEIVIGKGGFGTVYLGQLGVTSVAVKMLSLSSAQGYKEFRAEAELLMRVHHQNLTYLVGYCDEGVNMGLIYEYMSKGNLRMHLSETNENSLSWEQRLQIAVDAAQGLDYLHKGCKPPMIHRDVKSTNILISENFRGKVADFGLSRAFSHDGDHVTTTVVGTPGYVDPEYFRTNQLNEKSDVYSFGIVLMEIITCRPVINYVSRITYIVDFITDKLVAGDISGIVDPRLGGNFNENSAWKLVELARACVDPESSKRPAMSRVVMELEQCLEMARARRGDQSGSGVQMSYMSDMSGPIPR